ncbi:Ferric siderophore transport system, periplasmic binding protein TonB [Acidisarcina polymorpha]|uniref:Ferric siderophore transport system, periplasmic binding protein TonB n=1 Tax=Acidisarcina polymorpha TaxID=2211140 RepID=A0A2Z5G603_9BACT|nr:energy transducer TonB [Acidisarcina polymorpha]AXC14389.1 Ferric siderophore transport system, periplasmic binding protein TonB [Acidisarcina polymorpha]
MPSHIQLDSQDDHIGKFTAGSLALHLTVAAAIAGWSFIHGHLHRESWGSNTTQGAIQATLVSNAPAVPLPQEQPPTPSVLATPTPSPAPAPDAPQPKATQQPEPDAIPIPVKQQPKPAPPKKVAQNEPPPKPQPRQPVDSRASRYPSPVPVPQNRATYGEAAPNMARSLSSNQGPSNPVNIKGGDFGSQFPFYVDIIKRTVARNWYQQEVQPTTPAGARVFLNFSVSRDGVPSNVHVMASSGSPTLDTSCLRAVQRVDTFGPLPSGYNQSSISVEYYCEYSGPNH